MRIPRVFSPQSLKANTSIKLDERSAHHCVQVLRLRSGDKVVVFNGNGGEFAAEITEATKSRVTVLLTGFSDIQRESKLNLHLYQAIARGDRMDYAIQKAVELGVTRITPLFTERCIVKLDKKKQASRMKHWEGVITSASEQAGRTELAEILPPVHFQHLEFNSQDKVNLLFHPESENSLRQIEIGNRALSLFIGPEGGWTKVEIDFADTNGIQRCRLGPRVLRTETATVASITAVQMHWGDLDI